MRRPRREPWSFWCILKCSVKEPMRSLSNAIWTSGLPVSVACVPYWSMRDFFCSLASTNLVHSCLIFQLFCNVYEVNTLVGWCKGKACSPRRHNRHRGSLREQYVSRVLQCISNCSSAWFAVGVVRVFFLFLLCKRDAAAVKEPSGFASHRRPALVRIRVRKGSNLVIELCGRVKVA